MIDESQSIIFVIILSVAIVALIITRKLMKSSFPYVFIGIVGLILGLLVGALLSTPLSRLPGVYGKWLPMIVNVFAAVAVLDLFLGQAKNFTRFFNSVTSGQKELIGGLNINLLPEILIDTSSLIDGRIVEVAETGFIIMPLAVPTFIVNELQHLADSRDPLKKERGKRGLESLEALKMSSRVTLRVIDDDKIKDGEVDQILVSLAKERGSRILTADIILSRTATVRGISVLNLNNLANSLKPVVYPGDKITINIMQKGKEKGQGVGYLADGSMVVVDDAARLIGDDVDCVVARIFPTASGRMVFAELYNSSEK